MPMQDPIRVGPGCPHGDYSAFCPECRKEAASPASQSVRPTPDLTLDVLIKQAISDGLYAMPHEIRSTEVRIFDNGTQPVTLAQLIDSIAGRVNAVLAANRSKAD